MRLILALQVLVVVLSMVLEAQAAPDMSSALEDIPENVKEFGNQVKEKVLAAITRIKESELPSKTGKWFLETFQKIKEQLKETF